MAQKISKFQRYMMVCLIPNIIMFIVLNFKILALVGRGHGSTKGKSNK